MVVTIYNIIHNENDLTKKKRKKTKHTNKWHVLDKLVIKQNM